MKPTIIDLKNGGSVLASAIVSIRLFDAYPQADLDWRIGVNFCSTEKNDKESTPLTAIARFKTKQERDEFYQSILKQWQDAVEGGN